MSRTIYIHTLDGKPAVFDGTQLCYASHYGPGNRPAESLKQIRDEQAKSLAFRVRHGWDEPKQGYVRYRIEEGE